MGAKLRILAARATCSSLCEALGLELVEGQAPYSSLTKVRGVDLKNGFGLIEFRQYSSTSVLEKPVLQKLSRTHQLFLCNLHENLLESYTSEWRDGAKVWSIYHSGQEQGFRHRETKGTPPDPFEKVWQTRLLEQDVEDAGEAEVDFVFDVPIDLFEHITGYNYSRPIKEPFLSLRVVPGR